MSHRLFKLIPFLAILFGLSLSGTALAAKSILDSGQELNLDNPYTASQTIPSIFDTKGIYGKLEGTTPVDIYHFKPEKDGEQTFSLLAPKKGASADAQPLLILVDPTSNTEATPGISLQAPSDKYHFTVLNQSQGGKVITERVLLQQFNLYAQQRVKLSKGQDYYLIVLDNYQKTDNYVISLGEGKSWAVKDFFTHFPQWLRLETNTYAGSSPFKTSAGMTGFIILELGLAALVGIFIIQEILSLLANKRKAAGYLLIKLQPYSRVTTWVSLWFVLIGAYIFFNKVGWTGIPFVLVVLFVPLVVLFLYQTVSLSPRLYALEVSKQEAVLPLPLRKRWFFSNFFLLLLLAAILVFLGMYLGQLVK